MKKVDLRSCKSKKIDELVKDYKSIVEVLGTVQQTPKEPKDKEKKNDKTEIKQT